MKRRRTMRWAILAAAGIIALAASVLMVAIRYRAVIVSHTAPADFRSLTVSNGAIWYGWARVPARPAGLGWACTMFGPVSPRDSNFVPYRWSPKWRSKQANMIIIVPLWMVIVPSVAAATWAGAGLRRRAHRCGCGYSRAGLDVGARCPECGREALPG